MNIPEGKKKKNVIIAVLVTAAALSAYFIMFEAATKDERVRASGTVEVTELNLSPQAGGRILELKISESDHITKGQLIAKMSLDGADHDVAIAEASLEAVKEQLLEFQNGFRKEDSSRAEAEYALSKAQHDQAVKDGKRLRELSADGVVSVREAELY